MVVTVGFKRITGDAVVPTKGHPSDTGWDIYASEDTLIYPNKKAIVPTGIAIDLPERYDATMRPRSGISSKINLNVILGTIDNAYTGGIGVIVENTNTNQEDVTQGVMNVLKMMMDNMIIDANSGVEAEIVNFVSNSFDKVAERISQGYLDDYEVNLLDGKTTTISDLVPKGTLLVRKGDKLGQLCIHSYPVTEMVEVDHIEAKDRGANGFGSTGV